MKMLASRIAKELEKSKHCGIYEPELSRIWPDYGKPREPQIALFAEQHGWPASLLQGRILRNFSIKGRLPELLFTRFVLRFGWPGATLLALDCIFGAPFVLQRSHTEKIASAAPRCSPAATKRADDPKITLGAPALRHDVIASSQGVGFIVHALFSRLLFMSRET